jgi:hypothetical protein
MLTSYHHHYTVEGPSRNGTFAVAKGITWWFRNSSFAKKKSHQPIIKNVQ